MIDADGYLTSDILLNALYRLNISTGAATKISGLSSLNNIYASVGGILYAQQLDSHFKVLSLGTVNAATGVESVYLSSPPNTYVSGAVATPEPGTITTLGAGFLALALSAVRRRN